MRKFLALGCALAFAASAFMASPASAQQAPWRITAREGVVRVRQPGQDLADATLNQNLREGASVATGADGRATLENGAQHIVMTPNSRMTIAPDSNDAMTRILQDLGSVLFQVDHREASHFRVETPLLAAVVKGTTFTVSTGPQQDMVHVSRGLVEVRANEGGAANDVAAGVTARIARAAPGAIAMTMPAEPASVTQAVAAPALDYAVVSGGVVDAASKGSAAAGHGGSDGGNRQNDNAEGDNGGGANLFGQSVAAVRSMFASLLGGNNGDNGNGNGNGGANGGNGGNGGGGGGGCL
ncbi:MAG: FecR family protein, partial [Terricaulis sp.]